MIATDHSSGGAVEHEVRHLLQLICYAAFVKLPNTEQIFVIGGAIVLVVEGKKDLMSDPASYLAQLFLELLCKFASILYAF